RDHIGAPGTHRQQEVARRVRDKAVPAQVRAADRGRVGQAAQDHVGPADRVGRRRRHRPNLQALGLLPRPIPDRYRKARGLQPTGESAAHPARAQDRNLGGFHFSSSCPRALPSHTSISPRLGKLKWMQRATIAVALAAASLIGCSGAPPARAAASPHPTASPQSAAPTPTPLPLVPLAIDYMRQQEYPGSDLVIEQRLAAGSNYQRYIASYRSDGLKINGLLTVPNGPKPATGWPVIIFNHGYIPPAEYRTTERYVAYVDAFARRGYIVFKSDYRGHGSSEGQPASAYGSPD